jgi:hypothetical protein
LLQEYHQPPIPLRRLQQREPSQPGHGPEQPFQLAADGGESAGLAGETGIHADIEVHGHLGWLALSTTEPSSLIGGSRDAGGSEVDMMAG